MPFQKGQSGNPRGRPPRSQDFAEVLRAQLDAVKNGTTTREQIAAVVLEKARRGDMDAIKWVVDRADGKIPDRLETSNTHQHEHDVAEATLDALAERWLRVRGGGA